MGNKYYVYVLRCGDGSLYCGYTTNVSKRVAKHQKGTGAKYTRSHLPVRLIYYQTFPTKNLALSAEYRFKHQSRRAKISYLRKQGVKIR